MKKLMTVLIGFALWGGLYLGVSATPGVTSSEILIGISNAQSGPAQFLGQEYSKGATAYFKYINNNGGINGRKIRLVQYDDGYEPDRCIRNTMKLINSDNVFLLFGYVGTPTAKAVVPIVQQKKVPYFFPFTGAGFLRDTVKSSYVFNLRGTYDMETEAMVDYLVKKRKKKIAILYQDDSYGRAGLSGTLKALKKHGLELVSQGTYKRNTVAVNSAVLSIKKGKPNGIIMIGAYKPCAEFIKRAKKMGLKRAIFLNISFVGSKALAKELASKGDNVIITQVVPFPWKKSIAAVNDYQIKLKQFDSSSEPGFVSLEGYLAAKLLSTILEKAGSDLNRDGLVQAAEQLQNLDLGNGDLISYSQNDHQGFNKIFMTQIKKGNFVEKEF